MNNSVSRRDFLVRSSSIAIGGALPEEGRGSSSGRPCRTRWAMTRATNSGLPSRYRRARRLPQAMAALRELAGPDGLVVVTGSIYIVGEAMRLLGMRI